MLFDFPGHSGLVTMHGSFLAFIEFLKFEMFMRLVVANLFEVSSNEEEHVKLSSSLFGIVVMTRMDLPWLNILTKFGLTKNEENTMIDKNQGKGNLRVCDNGFA